MDHTSGSQTTSHASSSDMAPLDPPSSNPPQVLYMTPNHRVTKARYVTSSDPRGYVPVYEYPLNGQWIMMDTDDGYVLWTGIWKADIVKILESQPDLANKLRRVRGGYLKMQGTWMARDVALELARRVAWNIRYDLVPLFGPSFPESCLSPDQPGYGKVVTRPPVKARRSKRSGQQSPPVTGAPPPFSQTSPISPINGQLTSGSVPHVTDLFESPIDGNVPLAPDRTFDPLTVDEALVMYGTRGAPEQPRNRSYSHSSGQLAYSNQSRWSSLASIKQESGQEQYGFSEDTATFGSQLTSTSSLNQYNERFGYNSSQQEPSNPPYIGQGINQMRRGSVPHISGYTAAAVPAPSRSYTHQDEVIKQERNLSGDSGYGGSFSRTDPSYGGRSGIDFSGSSGQYAQYPQPTTSSSPDVPVGSMHERSRSDSRYAPYHRDPPYPPIGYGSPTQQAQQGRVSAPQSAQDMGFPPQHMHHQSQSTAGYTPAIDQYHPQQSSTQSHTQSQFYPSQEASMVQQLSPHTEQSSLQYAATGMGAVATPHEYGYSGYQSHTTEPNLHGLPEQQSHQSSGQYRGYGNQF